LMKKTLQALIIASCAVTGLTMMSSVSMADDDKNNPPAAAPTSQQPTDAADAMRQRIDEHFAQAMAERERRYELLRQQATELGFEMPELPPFETLTMPPLPKEMDYPGRLNPDEIQALREQRWAERRARAAEHGIDLPETPPWKAAEERRQQWQDQFEQYKATFDALSQEQKEAVQALFAMPAMTTNRSWPGYGDAPYHRNCDHGYRRFSGAGGRMPYGPSAPYPPMPPTTPDQSTTPAND
jgi:hypothetical protein